MRTVQNAEDYGMEVAEPSFYPSSLTCRNFLIRLDTGEASDLVYTWPITDDNTHVQQFS